MIQSNRVRRAKLRELRRARKAMATGQPQPMRVHLVARGLDPRLAKNYAGSVSRKVLVAADQVDRRKRLKGGKVACLPTYVYTACQVDRALRTYVTCGGPGRKSDRPAFVAIATAR